jgi:hypothetical protein
LRIFACRIEYHRPILEKNSVLKGLDTACSEAHSFLKSCQVNSLTQLTSSILDTMMILVGLEVLEVLKLSFHLFGAIGSSKTVFDMFLLGIA